MVDYTAARMNMVDSQIRTNKVTDAAVISAFESVPREAFVPDRLAAVAYVDKHLPLGNGRFVMEPMVLARLLQEARLSPADVVLDVGCGTGYATAIMARLAATVVALESDAGMAARAAKTLADLDIDNAIVVQGPLAAGCVAQAPFGMILINGAVPEVPQAIHLQLADGGRLVTVLQPGDRQGRGILMQRHGDVAASRVLFDTDMPVLPEFAREPGFVF